MNVEDAVLLSIICGCVYLLLPEDKRWWVRPWLTHKGNLHLINNELNNDSERFKAFLRMDKATFEDLLSRVGPKIEKKGTKFRDAIPPRDRLIITLRYLATGESMKSLHYSFRVGHSSIAEIIHETSKAIYDTLKDEFLKVPRTAAEWLNIASEFEDKWQFPNCLGALDGKHIVFQAPKGSIFYNYKGTNSIVLLALVDAQYNFLYVDIGTNGRISDRGVFRKSKFFQAMCSNDLNFPEERSLPGSNLLSPYVIVADSAFALMRNIMKPFPLRNISFQKRVFNYRLSRARRVVENAFGLLANRWRILLNTVNLSEKNVRQITQACVALHNYLLKKSLSTYVCSAEELDRRYTFRYSLSQQQGNHWGVEATRVRENFKTYFNGIGAVHWQNDFM